MPWPTANYTSGGVIRATLVSRLHGQECNNVFWLSHAGELQNPDWPAILLQAAQDVLECAITALLPGLSSQVTIENCKAMLMSAADKIEAVAPAPANSNGALAESLPSTVAAVVSLRTPYSGKRRRGRFYVPGVPEAQQANSLMTSGSSDAIIAFVTCMLGKFRYDTGTANQDWIIYSRRTGYTAPNTYSAALEHYAPVTQGIVRTTLGTMRSRRLGRGV